MNFFNDITFAHPWMFWFFLLLPGMVAWYIYKILARSTHLTLPEAGNLESLKPTFRQQLRHAPFIVRLVSVSLLILAIARPQSSTSWKNITTEGIDIVISLDISTSMLAQDFKPNRLEASKDVAIDFIESRPNDRIGLVIFSGESFTQCPLTTDHDVLKNLFSGIKIGMIRDGTAIGMGLATAINRIRESKAKSKVIILLTDGVNNQGAIDPVTASDLAKTFGVRVYTIGVGKRGKAYSPAAIDPFGNFVYDYLDVTIDEEIMKKIAAQTGGRYYRATDKKQLREIYAEIDKMEKTIIEEKNFTNREERFFPFAIAAGFLLMLEILLKQFIFRSLP